MKKIGAYRNRGAVVMALLFGFQLLTGTGLFCAGQLPHPSRSSGHDRRASVGATVDHQGDAARVSINADDHAGTLPCSCKKQKKCPSIPRATLTSNPTYRFHEVQLQLRSACCDSAAADMNDHRFTFSGAPPFMETVGGITLCSSTPLSITCVLLI